MDDEISNKIILELNPKIKHFPKGLCAAPDLIYTYFTC